jgi:hypothetical protein
MVYPLSVQQKKFITGVISLDLYLTYLNKHKLDLPFICDIMEYNDSDKILLRRLRKEYIENELPIRKRWMQNG